MVCQEPNRERYSRGTSSLTVSGSQPSTWAHDPSDGHLAGVVTGQFQRALAPDIQVSSLERPVVPGERCEAIEQLEPAQVLCPVDVVLGLYHHPRAGTPGFLDARLTAGRRDTALPSLRNALFLSK